MRLRIRTEELLATAFAEAVADGDHPAAEGWLRVALYAQARESDRAPWRPRPELDRAGVSGPFPR